MTLPPPRPLHPAPFLLLLCSLLGLTTPAAACHAPDDAKPPSHPLHLPRLAEQARHAMRQQDYPLAIDLFQQLTRQRDTNGADFSLLGHCLHRAGQHHEAAQAWTRALELGHYPPTTLYNLACASARAGDDDDAVGHLLDALEAGFDNDPLLRTDRDLDSIRSHPQVVPLIKPIPDSPARRDLWSADLDYLLRRAQLQHVDLYRKVTESQLHAQRDRILRLAARPDVSDGVLALETQRLMASIGDGHSYVLLGLHDGRDGRRAHGPALRRYPVEYRLFADGLFVTDASAELSSLVGAKVQRIEGLSVEALIERLAPLCSVDNATGVLSWTPRLLAVPEALQAAEIARSDGTVSIVVRTAEGREVAAELTPVDQWTPAPSAAPVVHQGLRVRDPQRPWFSTRLPETPIIYLRVRALRETHDESWADFCQALGREIAGAGDHATLLIDLRDNHGGETQLNDVLLSQLTLIAPLRTPGRVAVLINRGVFSAAMNLATDLERTFDPIFVGEPTGSSPNFIGENSPIHLPQTGLTVSVSSVYWQRAHPRDGRVWIAPTIPVPERSTWYFAGEDRALDVAREALLASLESPEETK